MSIPVKATSAQLLAVRTENQKGSDPGTLPHVLAGKSNYSSNISDFLKELFKKPWTGTVNDPKSLTDWQIANRVAVDEINNALGSASVPVELDTSGSGASYTAIRDGAGEIIGHIATVVVNDKNTGNALESITADYGVLHSYGTITIGKV